SPSGGGHSVAPGALLSRGRADEPFGEQTGSQPTEVQIAASISEALNGPIDRRAWIKLQQRRESARCANIAGWKYIEPSKAAQQHECCAPWTNPGQLQQSVQSLLRWHPGNLPFAELACLDHAREIAQCLRLPLTQTTRAQLIEARSGNNTGGGRRMVLPAAMFHAPTKSLYQTAYDAHAGIQAQLLEWHHIDERLEQIGEARRTQATQSDDRRPQWAVDWHRKVKECGDDIQAEHSPQSSRDRRGGLATADAVAHVRDVDRAAVLDFDEDGTLLHLEDSHILVVLPNVYQVRGPALQHSHGCLQMQWCSSL